MKVEGQKASLEKAAPFAISEPDVSHDKSRRVWQVALILYVIVLGVISALAYTKRLHVGAISRSHADKLIHFVLLGGASFLARRASGDVRMKLWNWPWGPFVVGICASLDEFAQALSPVRTFSIADLVANISGVVVFGWLAGWKRRDRLESKDLGRTN
jgi:polysaccharide biosynthesis protein VpsQ